VPNVSAFVRTAGGAQLTAYEQRLATLENAHYQEPTNAGPNVFVPELLAHIAANQPT
jgi:hypothetical protein